MSSFDSASEAVRRLRANQQRAREQEQAAAFQEAQRIVEALVDYEVAPFTCELSYPEITDLALHWAQKYGSEKAKAQATEFLGDEESNSEAVGLDPGRVSPMTKSVEEILHEEQGSGEQ